MKIHSKVFTVPTSRKKVALEASKRSFHSSLKWVLIVAQCFGQMPVSGISKPDPRFLKFSWKSWRCFYCILNGMGAGFLTLTYLYQVLKYGVDILRVSSMVFYVNTLLVTILFLKLAIEWPFLMRKWNTVDFSMRNYGWPQKLHIRIHLIAITVMSIAAVEYTLVKVSEILSSAKYKTDTQDILQYYFTVILYPQIFSSIPYSLWTGILFQIINILLTFAWSFNDVFIMLVSTALAVRFRQITARLRLLKKNCKADNINVWQAVREDYNRLSKLVKNVDNALSYIVLLSFSSNLYSILMQLFHSMRPMASTLEKMYFYFSFGFVILRTISVTLYGAWIYDESKEPINVLNCIPSEIYNVEIKRFMEQIKFDTVALTGKNFFCITRGLLLSMAGVIVTYELVIIQFNANLLKECTVLSTNGSKVKC